MYDLKELENNTNAPENSPRDISDRAYYGAHLTDSVFKTKVSHIPTDYLL